MNTPPRDRLMIGRSYQGNRRGQYPSRLLNSLGTPGSKMPVAGVRDCKLPAAQHNLNTLARSGMADLGNADAGGPRHVADCCIQGWIGGESDLVIVARRGGADDRRLAVAPEGPQRGGT